MQHVLDVVNLTFSRGGLGLRSAGSDSKRRVLGQLGGQSPNDPTETSSGGGSDFATVVHPHVAGFHIAAAGAARDEFVG